MNSGVLGPPPPAAIRRVGAGWPPQESQRQVGVANLVGKGGVMSFGGQSSGGSITLTDGREICYWRFFPVPTVISGIGILISTSAASSAIRLGIRAADWEWMRPGGVVIDAGTVDSTSTGTKEITINDIRLHGYYFVSVTAQGGGPIVRGQGSSGVAGAAHVAVGGAWSTSTPSDFWSVWGWYQNGISADLPMTWGSTTTNPQGSGETQPWVFMRRSST